MSRAVNVLPLERKPDGYFQHPRLELVESLPLPYGRVLDLGCGAGAVGAELLGRGAESVVGVELDEAAAQSARDQGYEVVHVGDAEAIVADLDDVFDTILCYDVLEHLVRPDLVLSAARRLATSGATLSVSFPNARHISLLYDLMIRGTFGYRSVGHRDSTHLRWLTRKDLMALVEESGWQVTRVHWPRQYSRRYALLVRAGKFGREFGNEVWWVQGTAR